MAFFHFLYIQNGLWHIFLACLRVEQCRLVLFSASHPSNRKALHKSLTLRAFSPRSSVLVCGPLNDECLLKFQGTPEMESGVPVSVSFVFEVILLQNISTELPFSFSFLRRKKVVCSRIPFLATPLFGPLPCLGCSDYFWGDAGISISNLDLKFLGARLRS